MEPTSAPPTAKSWTRNLVSTAIVAMVGFSAWGLYSHRALSSPRRSASQSEIAFAATVVNRIPAPSETPEGMVWIPGGEFSMGANDPPDMDDVGMKATRDARPTHRVYVDGFFMDKTDVTNAQFANFVSATQYVTVAERKPRAEDFPGAPPENLVPGSVVFSPPQHPVPLNDHFQWWSYVPEANWRHPLGPGSDLKGKEDYPVVHIATRILKPMPNGPASDCRRRRSGSLQRAAAWRASHSFGVNNSVPMASGWQTPIRSTSPITTRATMVMPASLRCRNIRPTAMACTTWRETSGNGQVTGIVPTITSSWPQLT